MLDAGEERFWDTVEDATPGLIPGEVLTDNGDVNPEDLFDVMVALLLFDCVFARGGVARLGGAFVLRSCGLATPVEDVESAYLQLADGLSIPGLCPPGLA